LGVKRVSENYDAALNTNDDELADAFRARHIVEGYPDLAWVLTTRYSPTGTRWAHRTSR
jgi:hypothetical protein